MSLVDFGFFVKITPTISALCPKMHFADVSLKNPEKKFKVGSKITCRVLNIDHRRKRITLTNKPSLINSNLPMYVFLKKIVF